MSRIPVKTISVKTEKYIPNGQPDGLDENAKEIANRPLIVFWKKTTREDRYNLASLMETKGDEQDSKVKNLGSVARYIWENCVVEVQNVLLDEGAYDSLKGADKNRLFNTSGIDVEIADSIRHIQEQSAFSEPEAKN